MSDSTLELINTIDELTAIHEFLKDDGVDNALSRVVKLTMAPDVPHLKAIPLIVELQALSATFALRATYYATLAKGAAGTDNNMKKNLYYTLADSMDKLVSSLKYMARPL